MANQTPPVAPAPGTATPEPTTPEPQPPPPGQATEAQQEPKFVTIEELDRREAQLKLDLRKADKQRANQIKQELKALKDTLTASGVQVTPQVEANLQDQISLKYEEPDEQPASTEADNLADIPPDWKNAIDMMAEAGVTIEKDTPEFDKYIKPLLSNPNPGPKLLLAVSQAITETQARLNLHKDKAQLRVPGGPGTQAPGEVVATSAKDYLNAAYQKK